MKDRERLALIGLAGAVVILIAIVVVMVISQKRSPEPPQSASSLDTSQATEIARPSSGLQTSPRSLTMPLPESQTPSSTGIARPAPPQSPTTVQTDDAVLIRAQLDEQARTILLAALRAQGGLKRLLAVRDWTIKGTATFYKAGQTLQVATTTYIKKPDKLRIDQQIAGQMVTMATDGKVAWMRAGGQILQLPQDKLDELKSQMGTDNNQPLTALTDPSYHFRYLKTVALDDQQADLIEVTSGDRSLMKLYFGVHTHQLIQEEMQTPEGPITVRLSDFRAIGGTSTAFRIETTLNNERVLLLVIDEMALDTGLKDDLFAKSAQ
jgi:hypothetical protein